MKTRSCRSALESMPLPEFASKRNSRCAACGAAAAIAAQSRAACGIMHGRSRLQARPAAPGSIVQAHRPLRIPLPRASVLARMRQARVCRDARTPLINAGLTRAANLRNLFPSCFAAASGARTWPHSRRRAASASNQLPNGLECRSLPARRIPRATASLHCLKIGRQSLFCAIIGQMRLIRL